MKNKIKAFFKNAKVKKIGVVICALAIMAMSVVNCFATDGTSTTISGDTISGIKESVTGIFTSLTSVFSFTNLLQFIAIGVVAAATIVLGYIGLRKLVGMIINGIKGRFRTV